jgi:hypothetical protein
VSKIWDALKRAELGREPLRGPDIESGLSLEQSAAIRALLRQATVGDAARECGLEESALQGWLRKPDFVAAYHAACRATRSRR